MTAVLGIGTAVPRYRISQGDAARAAEGYCFPDERRRRRLHSFFEHAGVRQRRSVLLEEPHGAGYSQSFFHLPQEESDRGPSTGQRMQRYMREAPPLAIDAAQRAISAAGIERCAIRHLVTVSCTGFGAPGVDLALIESLRLSRSTSRTHVGFMGCHGALNGLRVADALCRADPEAHVLLTAVELCSLHYQYGWNTEHMVANALFADGAAAVVLGPHHVASEGWTVAATGSQVFADSSHAMGWDIADHGFEMRLSYEVPYLIGTHIKPWLDSWLSQHDLDTGAIRSWAIHPGGPRIVDEVGAALALSASAMDDSLDVLGMYGNMSSPTVLFVLERLQAKQAERPCVALAFGPGLAVEAALFV